MSADDFSEVTGLVEDLTAGDESAAARLMPLVYDELRVLAGSIMQKERPDHTLQPTALVHEVCARLLGSEQMEWKGRVHFKAVAATAMRRVLINHARDRAAVKRGGHRRAAITLDEALARAEERSVDVIALEEALERLAALSSRQAQLVELRFFGGLTMEESAESLGIGLTTAKGEWAIARAWLSRQLSNPDHHA